MKAVLDRTIRKITPTKRERKELSVILKLLIKAADDVIKPLKLEKTLAGSLIRDTWLTDKKEIDLFILFPVSFPRKSLEKTGLEVGKNILKKVKGKYEIAYAEHPYVKGKIGNFSVDIVPCYKVVSASDIKSAVDRTPFHNRYITRYLKPNMSGEVRLLKQFCKSAGVYGSDIRTLGFSGYLCELLIIKYRSFSKLVNSARKWKFGKIIDIEGHCSFKDPVGHFKDQPLIVIDPTDPRRNVAASLSSSNFIRFVERCKAFYDRPSESYFKIERKRVTVKEFRERIGRRGTRIFAVKFERPGVVDDILWSQMRKTASRISGLSKDNEFEVFDHAVWSDERYSYMVFEMRTWFLPKTRKIIGPPVSSERHSEEFKKKYKKNGIYVEGGRWIAEVDREHRVFEGLLKDFLKRPEKRLLAEGVRSNIARSVSMGFSIIDPEGVEKLIRKNSGFAVFMKDYLEGGI